VVAEDFASGNPAKVSDLGLPGFGFCLVHAPDHPRRDVVAKFAAWLDTVAAATR